MTVKNFAKQKAILKILTLSIFLFILIFVCIF